MGVAIGTALAAMRDALLVEVEALRADRAHSSRELAAGARLRSLGRRTTYAFPDAPGARLADDLPVRLLVDDAEVVGEVASHRDGELVLGLAADLGPAIEHAVLVTDASFLLERLAARFADVLADEWSLSYDAVAAVLDGAAIRVGRGDPPSAAELNPEQLDAVRLGLGSSATYVWGPPGTGKTTTLAHLVAAQVRAGRSVLLVANTNTAVDTAVGRVAALLEQQGGLPDGQVLRPGTMVEPGVVERWQDRLAPEAVARRLAAPLLAERGRVAAELDALDTAGGREAAGEATLDADHDLAAERDRLRQRLEALDDRLAADHEALHHRAAVVATTVYQTWLGGLPERGYDVVVVDEASMLMLPMTAYAAGLARRAVVVAGDFRQLPAIVATTDPGALRWLATDAFTEVGLPADLAAGRRPPYLAALTTQYRMRPAIATVVSELFYADNPLHTGRAPEPGPGPLLAGAEPVLYVDTSGLGGWAGFAGRGSRFNPVHAAVVAAAAEVVATGPGPAVVTPYAAQERLVAALLVDRFDRPARGWVSTVHRFQGNEKDVVVVDLTDAPGVSPGPGARARGRDDPQARLLNVAVSRARDQLLVVADFDYLRTRTPGRGTARSLLDLVVREGAPLPLADVLTGPWSLVAADAAEPLLLADLAGADEDVALFTPYVTAHGMARWSAALRAALRRGVGVRVVTRPPAEQPRAAPLLDQMREAGVAVDLWAGAEERLLVVDGVVTWLGGPPLGGTEPTGAWVRCRGTALPVALGALLRPTRGAPVGWSEPVTDECDRCGGPTVLHRGAGAAGFACARGVACAGGRPVADADRDERPGTAVRGCGRPGCPGWLVPRRGRYGEFLGCTRYPVCPGRG